MEREKSSSIGHELSFYHWTDTTGAITLIQEEEDEKKGVAVISFEVKGSTIILNITAKEIRTSAPFLIKLLDAESLLQIIHNLKKDNYEIPTNNIPKLATKIAESIITLIANDERAGLKITISSTKQKIEKISEKSNSSLSKVISGIAQYLANMLKKGNSNEKTNDKKREKLQKLLNRLQQVDPHLAQEYKGFINKFLCSNGQ